MQFAFGRLRISPEAFWSMTMHELNAAMMAHQTNGSVPMARETLDQLMQQNPDRSR